MCDCCVSRVTAAHTCFPREHNAPYIPHLHQACPAAAQHPSASCSRSQAAAYLGCQWVLVGTCHNVQGLAGLVVAQPAPARALDTEQHTKAQQSLEQHRTARRKAAQQSITGSSPAGQQGQRQGMISKHMLLWWSCTPMVVLRALPQALWLSWSWMHSSYLHCCCGGVECADEVVKAPPLGLDCIQQCTTAGGSILHTQQGQAQDAHRASHSQSNAHPFQTQGNLLGQNEHRAQADMHAAHHCESLMCR